MKRRHPEAGAGFSLIEVIVAIALLALALVPLARAFRSNARLAAVIEEEALRMVAEGDKAARVSPSK